MLRVLSAQGPLLVAVDDAQWLDSASTRVLSFAVRRLEAEALGFLVAARVPGAPSPMRFDDAADPGRHQTILVGGLSVAALHELVKQHTGRSLSRPTMVRVAGICRGNPFYALEIAAALPDGHLESGPLPVPDSLAELIAARVEQLPAATRRALLTAAALSHPTTDLVDTGAMVAARRAGIVSIDRGRIQFAHPLLASAVYGRAEPSERRSVHRRLASAVTEPEERARHGALGAIGPDAAIARELEEAAGLAKARGAPGGAAELLDLAVGLTPPGRGADRAERLVAAAACWFDAGDLVLARASLDKALAGALAAPLRARALRLMGHIHARQSSFTEATEVAYRALEVAVDDAALRAEVELDLAYYHVSLGDLAACEEHARSALAAAEGAGATGMLADALAVVTMAEFIGGRGFDEDRIGRSRALEDPSRDRAWQMTPAFIHGSLLLYTGRLEQALAILGQLHTETLERGEESPIPFSCFYQAWICLWRGDLAAVGRLAQEARQTAALLDDPAAHAIALAASALEHAFDGSGDLARREALESVRHFQELHWVVGTIWPLWALGLTELVRDNPAAVDVALRPLAAMITAVEGGTRFSGFSCPRRSRRSSSSASWIEPSHSLNGWSGEVRRWTEPGRWRPPGVAAGSSTRAAGMSRGRLLRSPEHWPNMIAAACHSSAPARCWRSGACNAETACEDGPEPPSPTRSPCSNSAARQRGSRGPEASSRASAGVLHLPTH